MTTTTHPSSLDLEAFAVGEMTASVETHLAECAACKAFVDRVKGALSAGPSKKKAIDIVALAAKRAAASKADEEEDDTLAKEPPLAEAKVVPIAEAKVVPIRRQPKRSPWFVASTVAAPLAAAAALIFLLRTPSTRDTIIPPPVPVPTTTTADPSSLKAPTAAPAPSETTPDPETTFKGGIQIAVIRERDGKQTRFTNSVQVKPGDRLRVEVALDREQTILAAVMGEDSSWLELMPGGVRRPGTHFSDRSARVDSSPLRGTVIVGPPEAVNRARETRRFDGVSTVRIEWEAP
jgi:hypothetical protein